MRLKRLCNAYKIMYNSFMMSQSLTQQYEAPIDSDEALLIKSAQKGNDAALEALLFAYEKKVYNVAYRFMGNEADAYDMAQEALIKIYKGLRTFRLESSFSSWVYRLTVNTCLDGLRKRKKSPLSLDSTMESGVVIEDKNSGTPEEHALNIESREDIQKAINTLSDDHRITVVLRDIQGLSYDEIAETLNISIGTVKSRLSRGRQRLKEILLNK
jgi:RNA polymerase sigma-70 factor (ECF subfamily)